MLRPLLILIVFILGWTTSRVVGQGMPDRLEEMVIQNGGPGNTTTALAFTNDGARLYSAGLSARHPRPAWWKS